MRSAVASQIPTATSSPRGPALPSAVIELCGALLISAAVLMGAPRHTYPVRNISAELLMLAIMLPLGYWCISTHVRRRRPDLLPSARRLYLVAFLIRVIALQVVVWGSLAIAPLDQGHLGDDSLGHGFIIRSVMVGLGRPDSHWAQDAMVYGQGTKLVRSTRAAGVQTLSFSGWLWVMGGISRATGYSTIAANLAMITIGSFFLIQCWIFLQGATSQRTASIVALWMLLSPDQIVLSCGLHKDFATAIVLLYICEFGSNECIHRPRATILGIAPVIGWIALFRPQLAPLIAFLYAAMAIRRRLRPNWERWATIAILMAIVVAAYIKRDPVSAMMGWRARFDVALLANLWACPILKLSVNAFYENPNIIGMADLLASLIWPLVVGLLAMGVLLQRRLQLRSGNGPVLLVLCWQAIMASSGFGLTHRFRVPLDPLIIAYGLEALVAARRQPEQLRRALAAVAALVALAIYLVQVGPVLIRVGR